ncbi:MAG TPA: DUF4810 domain-containing protein [Ignavibacteria bacterium]|nr:DUF4810 domain-containing protein [Ignavibacteria bacterium]
MNNIQIKKVLIVLTVVLLFTGCGPQPKPPLYHWGTYSKSSSEFFHTQGEPEALQKHKDVLEEIVNTSESNNQRVAPGLYAELGQMYFKLGQREKAISYLEKEKTTYPESSIFIDQVLKQIRGNQ